MKKLIYSLSALLVLFVSCYTLVSCTESSIDATVDFSQDALSDGTETGTAVTGSITYSDIQNAVIAGIKNSGYETMGTSGVVLRGCSSESDAKSKAQSVADNAVKYLNTKYPNRKTDLMSSTTKFAFSIVLSYDGNKTKIYEETVR